MNVPMPEVCTITIAEMYKILVKRTLIWRKEKQNAT